MEEITNYEEKIFEDIKHIDEKGCEYWEARELRNLNTFEMPKSLKPL